MHAMSLLEKWLQRNALIGHLLFLALPRGITAGIGRSIP